MDNSYTPAAMTRAYIGFFSPMRVFGCCYALNLFSFPLFGLFYIWASLYIG